MVARFKVYMQCFLRDLRGSVSVETVLIAPLLMWGMVATYVFYDGFRHKARVQVAANTVADVMSRQTNIITPQFIDDLNAVFDVLAGARGQHAMRITSVAQQQAGQPPVIAWSHGTRGIQPATQLSDLKSTVPPILTGEAAIVMETFGTWQPPFPLLGMERLVRLDAMVTARPRFVPWLHLQGTVPVFEAFNPEQGDPNNGYSQINADPFAPTSPGNGGGGTTGSGTGGTGTSGTGTSGSGTSGTGTSGTGTSGTGTSGSGTTNGSGLVLGNPNRPLQQVGLWDLDDPFNPMRDRATTSNSAQMWNMPSFRGNDGGLYPNDGGFWLDNCGDVGQVRRNNNGNNRYLHIPWHQSYDLTSATVRMVFRTDGLPINNNYTWNPSNRQISVDFNNGSVWGLFSRDATFQNEPGHFSSFVTGDGALFVRFQVWSDIQFYGQQYAGTNHFLYAPPGSVTPGTVYDMQITFDHEQSRMDLYLNGQLMDRSTTVPITLAGNREPWVLGASNVNSNTGSHRNTNWGSDLCGSIFHFEVWEGAYSAREVELMNCGIEPNTEGWYEFFYLNFGRYPVPGEGIPASANPAQCSGSGVPPVAPPPPPPSDPCQPQILFLDRNNITVPFWVDLTNIQVGDYITFNSIGQTTSGQMIDGRVTMTARSHPDLRVRMAQTGGTFLLDAQGRADLSGQTADFTLAFINQATGQPVAHTGTLTFSDIDRVTDARGTASEVVALQTTDFISFHRAPGSSVAQGTSGGYTTFTGTVDTIGSDRNAWATGMFHNRETLGFRLNARNYSTGYGLTQQAVTCGLDPNAPLPTCTETNLATQNFETLGTDNWSIPRTEAATAFTRFLGRFGQNETVTWSRTLPANTTQLEIEFDLYVMDSWDGVGHGWSGPNGDRLDVLVNNQLIGFRHFRHHDPAYGNASSVMANVGGASYTITFSPVQRGSNLGFGGWEDERWRVTMSVTNPPASFNLGLLAHLDLGIDDESWGLDNFLVRTACQSSGQATPTHIINTTIPFWWTDTFENWFTRPTSIPSGDWNGQPFSITGGGGIQARDGAGNWVTSGNLGFDGVQLRMTTPAHGTTATAMLQRGPHLIQYNFTRAANP